jgi:DNA-binding protein H-NS
LEDLKAKLKEIKEDVVTTKSHDFFTEMPYENFEWLIGYAEESLKIESELRDKVEQQQQEIEQFKNDFQKIYSVIQMVDIDSIDLYVALNRIENTIIDYWQKDK